MRASSVSLSYGARREVLAQTAPRYQEAAGAQKMLLLDRVVEVTGYARKYAIQLLNHVPQSATRILRPRQPTYSSRCKRRSSWLGVLFSIRVRSAWSPFCPNSSLCWSEMDTSNLIRSTIAKY